MPLMDHFHPPLSQTRHWESFHGTWANEIMASLNGDVLPSGYFAEAHVNIGGRVEVDVASFEHDLAGARSETNGSTAVQACSVPTGTKTIPLVFPDEIEIQVFSTATGANLVAAIELISPANKDRPETRRAFAVKCAAYLHQGIGLVVIDVVTNRQANLHDELIKLLREEETGLFTGDHPLYAISYHPSRQPSGAEQAEMLFYALVFDEPLPTVPLALRDGPTLPLDLETTYMEARGRSRL